MRARGRLLPSHRGWDLERGSSLASLASPRSQSAGEGCGDHRAEKDGGTAGRAGGGWTEPQLLRLTTLAGRRRAGSSLAQRQRSQSAMGGDPDGRAGWGIGVRRREDRKTAVRPAAGSWRGTPALWIRRLPSPPTSGARAGGSRLTSHAFRGDKLRGRGWVGGGKGLHGAESQAEQRGCGSAAEDVGRNRGTVRARGRLLPSPPRAGARAGGRMGGVPWRLDLERGRLRQRLGGRVPSTRRARP